MQLKYLLLNKIIVRNFYRNYVSLVSVNVNSFKAVKVKSKDPSDSSDEVKLTLLDEKNKAVDPTNVDSLNILITEDAFKVDCCEPNSFSATLELPASSPEVQIEVSAGNSNIQVENLQAKTIEILVKTGGVHFQSVKSESIIVEVEKGNVETKGVLLAKNIRLVSRDGNISIAKSQGDNLEVEAASIKIGSCYSHNSKFTSTREALLKNVHGNSLINSSGKDFGLSGFSGNLQAQLDNEKIKLQLSVLTGGNKISSTNSNAEVNLGLSDDVISKTNFNFTSNCSIDSYISELIPSRRKKSFEVKRESSIRKSLLQVDVKNGKSFELNTMSWIDFLKFT